MTEFANQALKFSSEGLPENTLLLTKLNGTETLSGLFRFELELISSDPSIDLDAVLYQPAQIGIERRADVRTFRTFNGVLEEFEELEQGEDWTTYRAVMVPALHQLKEFYRSRIVQNVKIEDLVTEVLSRDLNLAAGSDFEFELSREGDAGSGDGTSVADGNLNTIYPEHEYVVQYEETDFDFVSRWLEHEGVFYFFENDGTAEKVVFADARSSYKTCDPLGGTYLYRPQGRSQSTGSVTSGEQAQTEEILSFKCRVTRRPTTVALNDYNWRDPSNPLHTTADVHTDGVGVQNEYNDHYKTADQGAELAAIRAEEWNCRAKIFQGLSTVRTFRPGRTFALDEHFRPDFNAEYLITAVNHMAEQLINLRASTVTGATYENSFEAIPAELDFRPERVTEWPAIKGVMHAKIDGPEDADYAQLDAHGRYKVRFPYDQYSQHAGDDHEAAAGEASRWVRMAQPYAGVNAGMHFPLLKGTEVLITHIDGDPDRPVISGAVPNLETVCPVDQGNSHQNRIQTTTGNTILMDDDENMSGFCFIDASGRHIDDRRHSNQHFGSPTPGGGGGGAPGGGFDPSSVGPALRRALKGSMPLPKGVVRGLQGIGAGGDPDMGDPPTNEDGSNNLGVAGAATTLGALLHYHGDQQGFLEGALSPLSGEGAPLDTPFNLRSTILPNQMNVNIGDATTDVVRAANLFQYVDAPTMVRVYTGFNELFNVTGDIDKTWTCEAASSSKKIIKGDATEKKKTHGNWTKESETLGEDNSKSTFVGTKKVESFSMSTSEVSSTNIGATDSTTINLAAEDSLTMTMSAKDTTTISMAAEDSFSLTMSAKDSMSIAMAAEDTMSITMAAKDTTSITLATEDSFSLTLAKESKTDITVAGKDNLSVTVGVMNEISVTVAAKNAISISAGLFNDMSLLVGGKAEVKLVSAVMMSAELVGGTKIECTLAGPPPTVIKIPGENEAGMMSNAAILQKGYTTLLTNVTSALTKLGV